MIKNYTNVLKALISECRNWPHIIITKIFGWRLESIVLKNGIKIFLGDKIGKADLSMFAEIWYEKYYNPKGFEINKNDIIFDIGANNGFFSVYAASKALDGIVYAFEPVPYLAQKIKRSASLNNYPNIRVENLAVGQDSTKSTLYVSKKHNGCHSLYEREDLSEKITVSVTSLKNYCLRNNIKKINFLKLDCEGAEYEIINSDNIDFIKESVEKISMEYHDTINEHTHQEILNTLIQAGFETRLLGGYIYAINANR